MDKGNNSGGGEGRGGGICGDCVPWFKSWSASKISVGRMNECNEALGLHIWSSI